MRPQVKTTIIFSLLGLSLALNAVLAIGYVGGAGGRTAAAAPTGKDYCLLDRLDLDTAQQRRLADMRKKMHEKRAAYWKRGTEIKSELAKSISAAQVDRIALGAQLERYAKNQAAMQRAVAEHLVGVGAMLRPEQRDEFLTLLRTEMFRGIRSSVEP